MDAFEKYILEFFGICDMAIMESHLKQLKPNLLKIAVKNQTAGYVYYKEEDTKIIVDVFTLLPEYRNNGLGSLILQGFIKKADELNKPIFLDTFKSNPAKKFYERNGFVVAYILKNPPRTTWSFTSVSPIFIAPPPPFVLPPVILPQVMLLNSLTS